MDFNFRQYDPQTGRFLGVDPLGDYFGQDRYSPYAAMGNQPESMIDPNGLAFGGGGPETFTFVTGSTAPPLTRETEASLDRIGRESLKGFRNHDSYTLFEFLSGSGSYINPNDVQTFTGASAQAFHLTQILFSTIYKWAGNPGGSSTNVNDVGGPPGSTHEVYDEIVVKSKGPKWYEKAWNKLKNWWNSTELYFEMGGESSVGIQLGAGFEVNETKLKAEGNLISVDLWNGNYRQTGSDVGPETTESNHIGQNGIYDIKQGFSIPFVGYEHSFKTKGHGYINGSEVNRWNLGVGTIDDQGTARIRIGFSAALLLKIGGYMEFGIRRKNK